MRQVLQIREEEDCGFRMMVVQQDHPTMYAHKTSRSSKAYRASDMTRVLQNRRGL